MTRVYVQRMLFKGHLQTPLRAAARTMLLRFRQGSHGTVLRMSTDQQQTCGLAVFNPGVLLIRNTAEAREFFARVRRLTNDAKRMAIVRIRPCPASVDRDLVRTAIVCNALQAC